MRHGRASGCCVFAVDRAGPLGARESLWPDGTVAGEAKRDGHDVASTMRDADGHLPSESRYDLDGGKHHAATSYWPSGATRATDVTDDTGNTRHEFDAGGLLLEEHDADGHDRQFFPDGSVASDMAGVDLGPQDNDIIGEFAWSPGHIFFTAWRPPRARRPP